MKQMIDGKMAVVDPPGNPAAIWWPTTEEEAKRWKTILLYRPLHRNVLVVAKTRIEGAWCAYCFPVPGVNHALESGLWESEGQKVEPGIARAIFPQWADIPCDFP